MPIIVKVANTITYSIIPHLLLSKPRGPNARDCFASAVSGSADTDAPNDHNGIRLTLRVRVASELIFRMALAV